ncbi:transport and Golgi organization protein 6 homolog [Cimex lectularius]|uniref:Transport and Golgi organization protein 6 homolog n=1 Tax=Cimex lectularius TaxID=79782 RepID=A0A8I6RQ71_CIMLE|nr:transport and Golgi organization protein 6 homolog [Cimex lectularius]
MKEMTVGEILQEIENIITPNDEPGISLEDVLVRKCEKYTDKDCPFLTSVSLDDTITNDKRARWVFVRVLLEKLLHLRSALQHADEKEQLISINQKKHLSSSIEMAVTLGIVAHLPKGIGIPLKQRSSSQLTLFQDTTENEKISSLILTLSTLMELRKDSTMLTIITSQHLGDVLACLFSLLLPSVWSRPIVEDQRVIFKSYLKEIVEKTFQPYLIKELMLLNGNKECPPRLSHVIRCMMTERLMLEGGVIATIRAILDITGDTAPTQWKTVEILARLIIKPHIKDVEAYQFKVYSQVLSLLYSKEKQFMQIAVCCVKILNEISPETCKQYFLNELMGPLKKASPETVVTSAITALHNCIGIPCSDHWSLKPELFSEIHATLFRLYCDTLNSATFIKNELSDIVWSTIAQCDFERMFNIFVFEPADITFNYGDEGGIVIKEGKLDAFWEDTSDKLLQLVLSKEDSNVLIRFFNVLLTTVIDGTIEKKLVCAKLLAEVCAESVIQDVINKDPSGIVDFIKSLLNSDCNDEISCLGLMVLGVILGNHSNNNTRDWNKLKDLVDPLKTFMLKCKNREVRNLADELYCSIMTHGATTKEKPTQKNNTRNSSFGEAIDEATDALMPVRAHGIRQLGRLILANDSQAVAKKEMILCIFKENLKEEDSYVYLAAVEGLAAMATAFPDEVLTTLCEQYTFCKDPEIRLKVGEILVKVIRLLNEMAIIYKHELVNAFLDGCRDNDHLVRASSLSNLGELCKILSYRIHTYLTEIFYCIECIFDTDKFMEPRRAAVMVLTQLLKGLGPDSLTVLENILLELYRKLKFIYNNDKDDITKLHAQLALEEINACTFSFFRQPLELKKRIFVLDPPT